MNEETSTDTFGKFGKRYQEMVVQSVVQDPLFAEQMSDVLDPRFFELEYLQEIISKVWEHRKTHKTFPSIELIAIMLAKDAKESKKESLVYQQAKEYLKQVIANPLGGDASYIQASSLEFCKKQILKEAIITSIDKIEDRDYDSIQSIIKDALSKGSNRDVGHDYAVGFAQRRVATTRQPISTGWPVIDKILNGGWERKTLTTFIAPTGAGKSMFLCNVSAAAIEAGLNSLYISCEMADFKIGIRHDSYFSGVEINDIPNKPELVEQRVLEKVKGRLFIKEFPTKTATVQTIRAYIQRLQATRDFVPDILVVDYADLLRSGRSYGDKRHELEGVYEELRALAQEFNLILVTADQTNRGGLEAEIVTLNSISESYAKATVCDLIITISRRPEDKLTNTGRLFIAKSRLGQDGMVLPFVLNTATVKVSVLEQSEDPTAYFANGSKKSLQQNLSDRVAKLSGSTPRKDLVVPDMVATASA